LILRSIRNDKRAQAMPSNENFSCCSVGAVQEHSWWLLSRSTVAITIALAGALTMLSTVALAGNTAVPAHGTPATGLVANTSAAPRADFVHEQPAPEVRAVADWVARSHDNGTAPFLMVD